jgi:hypothetical protein
MSNQDKIYLFLHNDFKYIVSAESFSKAKYRLFKHACGTGFQGTFREFLQNEFENLGTITPEAAETIIDNEEAEWA